MNQLHSTSEIKAIARDRMFGKYGMAVALCFLYYAISLGVSIITSSIRLTFDTGNVSVVITLLSYILSIFLSFGMMGFFYNIASQKDYNISDLFWPFLHHPVKIILLYLLLFAVMFATGIPAVLLFYMYFSQKAVIFMGLGTLFTVAAILLMTYLSLSFAAIPYLMLEREDASVLELIRNSFYVMLGNRLRLLYLNISFLGWILLGIISCGIGLLWIYPYILTSNAAFYLDLTGILNEKDETPKNPAFDQIYS